ncbi:MAG: ion transporter [Gemmataceae bacterium]|nr:ion transporter [Gemmataceae bacterium]
MSTWCRAIADNPRFQAFIIALIVGNAVLLGVETNPTVEERHGDLINVLEITILAIFVFEITVRLLAHYPTLGNFFKDPWNLFDFIVVAVSALPAIGPMGMIARLARILRVVRLLSFSRQLRLIVDTLLRSIPSMTHVVLLLSILIYTYAILGIALFRDDDGIKNLQQLKEDVAKAPFGSEERDDLEEQLKQVRLNELRWGTVGRAAWSMFQTLTFENWVGLQDPLLDKYWWSPLFFGSFILLGVFIAMNLFVAVVMNNLEEVKAEHRAEGHAHDTYTQLMNHLEKIKDELTDFEASLQGLRDAPPPGTPGAVPASDGAPAVDSAPPRSPTPA